MVCEGCEQRRKKLKALINDSAKSISNAIAFLGGRTGKAEQPSVGAEQSTDSGGSDTEQSDTGIVAPVKSRRGRAKQP